MPRICLMNGRHTPGSQWEAECSLRNVAARSERARKAALTRYDVARCGAVGQPEGVVHGSAARVA